MPTKSERESKFRSRKWIALLIVFGLSTTVLTLGFIVGQQWVEVIEWSYGLFVTGNVAAYGVNKYHLRGKE